MLKFKSMLNAMKDGEIVVVVCHSDVIWWLTSEVKGDNERFGVWTKNAEILDITEFILHADREEQVEKIMYIVLSEYQVNRQRQDDIFASFFYGSSLI